MKNLILIAIASIALFSCRKSIHQVDENLIENCETFGQFEIAQNANGIWEIQNNGGTIYSFPNYDEAYTTKRILENYRATTLCSCGNGELTTIDGEEVFNSNIILYQLREDLEGIGNSETNSYNNGVEDCLPFDPDQLMAKKDLAGDWYLIERPNHSMFSFGKDKDACINTLKIIKKYGFNQSCFVGRPYPSFTYLKSYQNDTPPLTPASIQ